MGGHGQLAAQLRRLDSPDFCGDPRLRWRLPPSASPAEPAFESVRHYEPFTGQPLGSPQQSWTAAVVLDRLSVT